jgi:hypothetical protein
MRVVHPSQSEDSPQWSSFLIADDSIEHGKSENQRQTI